MNKEPKKKRSKTLSPYGEGIGRQLNPIEEAMLKSYLITKFKIRKNGRKK